MQLQKGKRYTVKDYQSWPDDERCELIDGVAYAMAPSPQAPHQGVVVELSTQLHTFLKGKPCKAFVAPFDVYLSDDKNDDTVVQPDIMVVCDRNKIKMRGIYGAPDIVVEVLSPSTAMRDMLIKRDLYERSGVREYWVVSTEERVIHQSVLTDGHYTVNNMCDSVLVSACLSGFELDVEELFTVIGDFAD